MGEGIAGLCLTQVALVVKNLPANAGDVRDTGSIPGSLVFVSFCQSNLALHNSFIQKH